MEFSFIIHLKKVFSIALLIVFLFNLAGYNVLIWALRYQAKKELVQHFNSNSYSTNGTLTIKIPMAIPYQMDWPAYERVDGDFEHRGEFYKLIKQKLERDTLYVVCIKDHKEKQLMGAMADFTKVVNDLPGTSGTLKLLGSFQKEYKFNIPVDLLSDKSGWCRSTYSIFYHSFVLLERNTKIFSPPPDSIPDLLYEEGAPQ